MATSMVKGNPVKLMLSFAFPLLIGNLLQQTYNIIDAAIVGQALGPEALASVGASSSVQFLVLGFCMGSCTGFRFRFCTIIFPASCVPSGTAARRFYFWHFRQS